MLVSNIALILGGIYEGITSQNDNMMVPISMISFQILMLGVIS